MRKIILEDVELEKKEVRKEVGIKEEKLGNNQTYYQPTQYYQPVQYQQQQPQQNPFQTDTKYEFMLIAMNPFIGFIYQIFKGLAWLITRR
jgi:hypothetical protein